LKYKIHKRDLISYKKKHLARRYVAEALKLKKICKPKLCEICDMQKKLEAHHVDYGKPLFVYWICKKCHGKVHTNEHFLNPKNNEQTKSDLRWEEFENVPVNITIPFENF